MSKGALRQKRSKGDGVPLPAREIHTEPLRLPEIRQHKGVKTTWQTLPQATHKSAIRKLAEPLADVTAFDNIVQGVITNNPFQCTTYNAGGSRPPAGRTQQAGLHRTDHLPGRECKDHRPHHGPGTDHRGLHERRKPDRGRHPIATALGGTPVRDFDNEKFAATLRCHDANGEIYFVNFSRDQVTLTSFSDDAIRSRVETWADTVAALG